MGLRRDTTSAGGEEEKPLASGPAAVDAARRGAKLVSTAPRELVLR